MKIIFLKPKEYFNVCVEEFVDGFKDKFISNSYNSNYLLNLIIRLLRTVFKILPGFNFRSVKNTDVCLSITVGPNFIPVLKNLYYEGRIYMYMFDVWPFYIKWLSKFAMFFNIEYLFFSSNQAFELFKKSCPSIKAAWVPEGIKSSKYRFFSIDDKNIDVLEFGRKYGWYHTNIVKDLEINNIRHLYSDGKTLLFETENEFIAALAKTKISICFPSSITHPERSGDISTMTLRYLQSMASKCLIVGIMPEDMKLLFDYVPIIEIDKANPSGQLISVLNNYSSYQELIGRNYKEVVEKHNWSNRIEQIKGLFDEG